MCELYVGQKRACHIKNTFKKYEYLDKQKGISRFTAIQEHRCKDTKGYTSLKTLVQVT